MKKINVKKLVASMAALSAVACMAAIPASAADHNYATSSKKAAIVVDQVKVTTDELKAANNQVPVIVKMNPNPSVNTLEFGISCKFDYKVLSPDDIDADEPTSAINLPTAPADKKIKFLGEMQYNTEKNGENNFSWLTWANTKGKTNEGVVVLLVTVPEGTGAGKYAVNYEKAGMSNNPNIVVLNEDGSDKVDYVESDQFEGISGWIEIVPSETTTASTTTTTTTSTTTTTTTESTTTSSTSTSTTTSTTTTVSQTTTKPTTSTTATTTTVATTRPTNVTTPKAYNPNLNPHRDEYYTQTTPKAVPAATARGGGEGTSPKTGASDVLPIAGAAAAVAVLGGVALVAKKKND